MNTIRGWVTTVAEAAQPQERYRFVTTCEDSDLNGPYGEAIHAMKHARSPEILDWDDILRLIGPQELARVFADPDGLADDFGVNYEKSVWRGIPCVYIVHSGIEHIFTLGGEVPDGPWTDEEE